MDNNTSSEIIIQVKKDLEETGLKFEENNLLVFSLTSKVSRVEYKKGSVIVNEGEEFDRFFFIAKGYLKVFRDVNDKRIFVRIIKPGEYVGLTLFSHKKKFPFSLITLENTVVYYIDKEILKEDIYNNPGLMKWVISDLSYVINELYRKIVYLTSKHMNGRVAEAIVYFADDVFKNREFQLPVTKKQLGHYANVSPENVTRILKVLEKEKILQIDRKNIKILDHEKLKQISKLG